MSRADLSRRPGEVAGMFDAVAARYDRTNAVLSLGLERGWRRSVARALRAGPGVRVLDLAAGTATSSAAIAATGATVVAADFSLGMLRRGRGRGLPLVAADGLALPFGDGVFDRVSISFGLRNVADVPACLRELARVTRPGGRLVVCEFSRPPGRLMRACYAGYLAVALPALSRLVSSSPDAYRYLVDSIRAWPDQPTLARLIAGAGWGEVGWRDLTGGLVALHRGRRP